MAVTYLISAAERGKRLQNCIKILQAAVQQNEAIQNQADAMLAEGALPATISTRINALLTDLNSLVTEATTELGGISFVYQEVVQIGCPASYTSASIDWDNSSVGGHIGAIGSTPYSVFAANDKVLIQRAEDAKNQGFIGVVSGSPTNAITFSASITQQGVNGVDNAYDTTLKLVLLERGT